MSKIASIKNEIISLFYLSYKYFLQLIIRINFDSNKIYIGFSGRYYNGNLKSIFGVLLKQKKLLGKELILYWLSNENSTLNELKKLGIIVYNKKNISLLPLFLKTNIWFGDHGSADIPIKKRFNSFWVQVWHGIPFKGFAGNVKTRLDFNLFDLHPVSSKWLAEYYINEIGVDKQRVKITGYPRSDDLINNIYQKTKIYNEKKLLLGKKTILYAPTWQHESGKPKPLFPWGDNEIFLQEFINFLKLNNLQLIIRTHPNWKEMSNKLQEIIFNNNQIRFESMNTDPDANKTLSITDICITDYSSIVNDFIVLDKPLIFIEPKTNLFKDGFALQPDERAGIIVKTKDDLFKSIISSIKNPNEFSSVRKKIINKIHYNLDGKASKRVLDQIETMLKHKYL